jgi:hypothetical protein
MKPPGDNNYSMIDLSNIKAFTTPGPQGWSLLGDAADFDQLPPLHKQQIHFLNPAASTYMYELLGASYLLTGGPWHPFAADNFKTVDRFDMPATPDSTQLLKKWLFNRGIAFQATVYMLPMFDDGPLVTNWKMLIKYSADFFSRDNVVVFDNSLNWCLYYHHDNYLLFGKGNMYDASKDLKMMEDAIEKKKKFPGYKPPYY